MDIRHKNKAIIGVVIWVTAMLLAIFALVLCGKIGRQADKAPDRTAMVILFTVSMLIQYVAFFWGGSHLAKAKGYTNGMLIIGIFWPAQFVILALLLFAMPDKCLYGSSSRTRRRHSEDDSQIGRVVRYRRNALVANTLGFVGILVALAFVFLPLGLFETRDNEQAASILIFLPSYAAVIYGTWWWVRAKNWQDGVILIGLLPLVVPFIPFVRLLYRTAPLLLPAGMVVMPIILLGVVAVLPDKSGMPKRKRWDRD